MTAPTERDTDEILRDYAASLHNYANGKDRPEVFPLRTQDAKEAIEAHYRQKFEKLIGEAYPTLAQVKEMPKTMGEYEWSLKMLGVYEANLRDKLRSTE